MIELSSIAFVRRLARVCVGLCALALLSLPHTASADSVSGKGLFNGKNKACNYVASAGNWHVISSAFSAKEGISPFIHRIIEPNYLMMVYDPLTKPGFRLQDVMGYEKRWNQYPGSFQKETKFLNYTGQWPFSQAKVGEDYKVGREPIMILYVDSYKVAFSITIPPGYRKTARPIPTDLTGVKASFTDHVFEDNPSFMTVKIGEAGHQLLAAYSRTLKRSRFSKFRGKTRISTRRDELPDIQFVSHRVPTYTKTPNQIKQQLRQRQVPDFKTTEGASQMLSYFINAAQSETDLFQLGVVERGQIIYETRLPEYQKAARLLDQGLDHYGRNLFNDKCW